MDFWTIGEYLLGLALSIGAVAGIRAKAQEAGKAFLASGRFAVVAVWAICLLYQLVTGRFDQLTDGASIIALLKDTSLMAATAVGGHAAWTTGKQMKK